MESGHTPSRRHPEYWGGAIPWIGIKDARAFDGGQVDDTIEYTNAIGIENSSARVLPAGTVCLSRTASVGYVVVMGRPMATSQDFVNFVCGERLNPRFLQYLFVAEGDNLLRFASGSVHQTIYFPEAKAFHVCIPGIAEQQRIVGILDEALEGIATAKTNAEQNLRNARALFESYLDSLFANPASSWETVSIGDVAELFDGPHATPKTGSEGPVFLGIGALDDGAVNLGETRHVSPEDFAHWTRRIRPEADDVVFSYETRLGQAAIIPRGLKCCLGRRMGLIRTDKAKLDPKFLVYQYISPPFRKFLKSRTVLGATVDRISLKAFPRFPIRVPRSLTEQRHVADGCEYVRDQTRSLESQYQRKLAALAALKKSLLQRAFSGQL